MDDTKVKCLQWLFQVGLIACALAFAVRLIHGVLNIAWEWFCEAFDKKWKL